MHIHAQLVTASTEHDPANHGADCPLPPERRHAFSMRFNLLGAFPLPHAAYIPDPRRIFKHLKSKGEISKVNVTTAYLVSNQLRLGTYLQQILDAWLMAASKNRLTISLYAERSELNKKTVSVLEK